MSTQQDQPSSSSAHDVPAAKAAYILPCAGHSYRDPPVIVGGEGCYLVDRAGRRFLDCYSGMTVTNAGHRNPTILNAVVDQLWRLQHTSTSYQTEPMFALAKALADLAPGNLSRCFFSASGSEANETAMLLATTATGRHEFIALADSLHGRTKWAMSATGLEEWRTDPNPVQGIHFGPSPVCPKCPLQMDYPDCQSACADELERVITDLGGDRIAAIIAEPILAGGGIIIPPQGYWQRVRSICDRHGLLLIFDEVQTAMNRTGCWFASEHWRVIPDILTMAGALGNGLPIAVTMTTEQIASSCAPPRGSTFAANPVSCAAALATIRFHASAALGQRSTQQGTNLLARLQRIAECSAHLDCPRGRGLMIGVDVVDEDGAPDAGRCDDYLERLKDDGFLVGKTGRDRNVLTLMPPLTITEEQIDLLALALERLVPG